MALYRVKQKIRHDGKRYRVGEVIDVDPGVARTMPWALELGEGLMPMNIKPELMATSRAEAEEKIRATGREVIVPPTDNVVANEVSADVPVPAIEFKNYVAVKPFQYKGAKYPAGATIALTADEVERFAPGKISLAEE